MRYIVLPSKNHNLAGQPPEGLGLIGTVLVPAKTGEDTKADERRTIAASGDLATCEIADDALLSVVEDRRTKGLAGLIGFPPVEDRGQWSPSARTWGLHF